MKDERIGYLVESLLAFLPKEKREFANKFVKIAILKN